MLPSSDFFQGFLHFYELTVNHLTANAILQPSIFAHLCEAFLGVPPSITLFWYFFWVKAQPSDIRTEVVEGANIQLWQETKDEYIPYQLKDSIKFWHAEWFYMENYPPALEKHTSWPPVKNSKWLARPTEQEVGKIQELLDTIQVRKRNGLTGAVVV